MTDGQSTSNTDWLSQFPEDIRRRIELPITAVFGPRRLDFGLDPVGGLRWILSDLDRCRSGSHVAWLIDQADPGALSEFEARVLFGLLVHVDTCVLVPGPTGWSRLLVVGRPRVELVGVGLDLDARSVRSVVRELRPAVVPVALLFVSRLEAGVLLRRRRLSRRLRSFLQQRDVGLGLYVPTERTEAALGDLAAEAAPLLHLAGDPSRVRCVRFEDPDAIVDRADFGSAARAAGLDFDFSLGPPWSAAPHAHLAGGAYAPLPFDQRSPASVPSAGRPIEIVRFDMPDGPPGDAVGELVHRRHSHRLLGAVRRLSFKRKERYFRRSTSSLELQQRYHDYLMYNVPPQDPMERFSFVSLGARRGAELRRVLREAANVARGGIQPQFLTHQALAAAASSDAAGRLSRSARANIEDQLSFHDYLAAIPPRGDLRPDLRHFLDFIPEGLGVAVELGSGYGRLAQELSWRAARYVCLDVSFNALRAASEVAPPVLADVHLLPFRCGSVDTLIANNSLEHLYDPSRAFAEIARVLKPGGRLLSLIPLEAYGPDHDLPAHVWKADERGIRSVTATAGLEIGRLEVVDIYDLGVAGSFPSCRGLVAEVEAVK